MSPFRIKGGPSPKRGADQPKKGGACAPHAPPLPTGLCTGCPA